MHGCPWLNEEGFIVTCFLNHITCKVLECTLNIGKASKKSCFKFF